MNLLTGPGAKILRLARVPHGVPLHGGPHGVPLAARVPRGVV